MFVCLSPQAKGVRESVDNHELASRAYELGAVAVIGSRVPPKLAPDQLYLQIDRLPGEDDGVHESRFIAVCSEISRAFYGELHVVSCHVSYHVMSCPA